MTRVPWGRMTLALHLALFSVAATVAWRSTMDRSALVPLAALPATLLVGLALLVFRGSRRVGVRIVLASVASVALEVVLVLSVAMAYLDAHPGWELS